MIDKAWLDAQAKRTPDDMHPLYGFLESTLNEAGIESWLDGLDRTLGASLGGRVRNRARRLAGSDAPDYWSAVDELSIATRLSDCGFAVTLGNPDVIATSGSDTLGVELTAPRRTSELESLQSAIAAAWAGPGSAILYLGRETYRPIQRVRRQIVDRVTLAARKASTNAFDVALDDLVEPNVLQIRIDPNLGLGVVSRTTDILGHYNPVPDIEAAIASKRAQIGGTEPIAVAVNLNGMHVDPYSWGIRHRLGAGAGTPLPSISTIPNVVGAVAFFRQQPGLPPLMAFWLRNDQWTMADPPMLGAVLRCLGVTR